MIKLFHSKKALVNEVMAVVITLLGFGILTIIGYLLTTESMQAIENTDVNSTLIEATGEKFIAAIAIFDYLIVIVMVLLIIGIGIASYKIAAPPIFWLTTFIMAAFMGYVSYFFNFLFAELVSEPVFASVIAVFPRTILICTNLHWVAIAAIAIGSITLYAKKDKGQFV